MQNIPYLQHVALERRPVGTVPNSTNVLSQGAMASGFSSRADETLKGFWIFNPPAAVERNASFKSQSNLRENCENIIFAGTQANRKQKHKKKKVSTKKKRIKKSICITKLGYDDSHSTLVYFTPELLEISIVTIFRSRSKQFRTCSKLSLNYYCLCTDTVTTIIRTANVASHPESSLPDSSWCWKKTYWCSA